MKEQFAEVILSQRFPKHMGIFDYAVPAALADTIQIGQLVSVPFRGSKREGVVIKLKPTGITGKRIKAIDKIIERQPFLTPEQITMAQWMAAYYFVSLGTVIKSILPPMPKRAARSIQADWPPTTPVQPPTHIKTCAQEISSAITKQFTFCPNTITEKYQLYYEMIWKRHYPIVFIVPDNDDMKHIAGLIPKRLHPKTVFFHSQLNKNQQYAAYTKVRDAKAAIIVGTKLAVFLPLQKPKLFIIDQADDYGHKQSDQNPRYDVRATVAELAKLHRAGVVYATPAPSITMHHDIAQGRLALIKTKQTAKPRPRIIDMRAERKSGNFQIFADTLRERIDATLVQKKKIFLFINKRGSASAVVCRDCGTVLSCPVCNRPHLWHQASGILYCHQCNTKHDMPPFCPHCSGAHFKFTGMGTQKVEHEVNKIWPQARVVRLDKDKNSHTQINTADIIVGTEFALPSLPWDAIGLTGIVSADTFLHLPDYRSNERTWQLLTRLQYMSQAPVIIQTYSANEPALRAIASSSPGTFISSELSDRKILAYPPYGSLIKLSYQHADKHACMQHTQQLHRQLLSSAGAVSVHIMTPLRTYQHGKWQMYIIIKFKTEQLPQVKTMLGQVPNGWIIDRDPINLL